MGLSTVPSLPIPSSLPPPFRPSAAAIKFSTLLQLESEIKEGGGEEEEEKEVEAEGGGREKRLLLYKAGRLDCEGEETRREEGEHGKEEIGEENEGAGGA